MAVALVQNRRVLVLLLPRPQFLRRRDPEPNLPNRKRPLPKWMMFPFKTNAVRETLSRHPQYVTK